MKGKEEKTLKLTKAIPKELPILIDCPECHSFISEHDINQEKKIAKCIHCNYVFSYVDETYWDPFGLPTATQPGGLELLRLPSFMEIKIDHYHTNRGDFWGLLFFTIIWNLFLLIIVFSGIPEQGYAILAFTSIHFLAGLGLIWIVLGRLFNKTLVHLDHHQLYVSTGPFRVFKRRQCFDVANMDQFYVVSHNSYDSKGRKSTHYSLQAHFADGTSIKILADLDPKTLYYLEKEIERYLNIEDQK